MHGGTRATKAEWNSPVQTILASADPKSSLEYSAELAFSKHAKQGSLDGEANIHTGENEEVFSPEPRSYQMVSSVRN